MPTLYTIKKINGMYRVLCGNTVMFSSASRANCKDWLAFNFPEYEHEKALQTA